MTGWEPDFLQEAIDTCTNESGELSDCALFVDNGPLLSEDEQRDCKFVEPLALVAENVVAKTMTELPGGVQIQDGPESATPAGNPIDQVTSVLGSIFGGDSTTTPTSSSFSSTPPSTTPVATTSSDIQSGGAFIENPTSVTPSTPDFGAADIAPTSSSTSTLTTPSTTSTLALPTTTSAPLVTSEPGVSYEVYSTQTITSAGGLVEEIVWMQPVVYVTEDSVTTVTLPAQKVKARSHVMQHRHNHGRRGH